MVGTLISGNDPEDGSLPLTSPRLITILGLVTVQVALVCVWRLVTMVRRGTVFSHAAFHYGEPARWGTLTIRGSMLGSHRLPVLSPRSPHPADAQLAGRTRTRIVISSNGR